MTKHQKTVLFRIIFSAVLLAAVWFSPLEGTLRLFAFIVPYLLIGYDVLWSALRNIFRGQVFDENFLMSLATIGAFVLGEYPEAVAVMLFSQIGELFEDIAVGKSRKSIAALMDICPETACVVRDGAELVVSPDEIAVGETIIVRPGEKIPLDGSILEGFTTVNTSALTGEALPQEKAVGDEIISGTVNLSGLIRVRVKSEFADSTVSKILELVENASEKKTRTEGFITRFARYYTPCVVIGAVLLALIPPIFFTQPWNVWVQRALIFLVVSCPCALVISVPLSFFGGIGSASRQGILIKGSSYLEALSKTGVVVFDKTGTLTEGNFIVTAIHPETVSEAELLDLAAAVESYSNHPIAESIIHAHGGHIDHSRISEVSELPGMGVVAIIDGKTVHAGNGRLMDSIGAAWHECHVAGTSIHVAEDGKYMGHIVICDRIKPGSKTAISALRELGIEKTVMLTGDSSRIAQAVGQELGLDEICAELLPSQKVDEVERLLKETPPKRTLAFVGDGINDAPVLSRSDLGIAMGGLGSDAAIEAADVVLMDDNPLKIAKAIRLSRFTMIIVKENIIFALGVKAAVMALGATGHANIWLAVFADVGVMVLAIINAMRCLNTKR